MQSYWYYKWFKNDDIYTRKNLLRGYRYVLIQSTIVFSFLFAFVFILPETYFPDKYTDENGNE